jgi:hypothetical protein
MRKKHGSVPTLHTCSGPESRNEQKHWHLECHFKRNSGSPLRRYEQPHSIGVGLRSNRRLTSGSPPPALTTATTAPAPDGRAAAAQASGWALLRACPCPRQRSRGKDKYEEPEARSADGGGDPVGDGDFSSRFHLDTDGRGHQPPGRSPLKSSRMSGGPASARRRHPGAKGRTTPEHERRPSSARHLGRSSRVHGAAATPGRRGHREPSWQARHAGDDDVRRRPAPRCRSPGRPQGQ